MYYLRWGNIQSGPYESHQILQMAEHGMVVDTHEVVDSVTSHSMTVGSFRAQMSRGVKEGELKYSALGSKDQQRIQIEQLQKQQEEIERLKAENERFAQRITAMAEAQLHAQAEAGIQTRMQQQYQLVHSHQAPDWAKAFSNIQMQQMQRQYRELNRLREDNQRFAEQITAALTSMPMQMALPTPMASSPSQLQLPSQSAAMSIQTPLLSPALPLQMPVPDAAQYLQQHPPTRMPLPERPSEGATAHLITAAAPSPRVQLVPPQYQPQQENTARLVGMYSSAISDVYPAYGKQKRVMKKVQTAFDASGRYETPLVGQLSRAIIPAESKSRATYALLALFLGTVGVHNFYARRYGYASLQLGAAIILGWTGAIFMVLFMINLGEILAVDTDGDGMLME